MKKFLSIMMVAFMAISFAACSSEEKKSAEDQACDEVVELCGKMEKAVKAGNEAEILRVAADMQELGEKMQTLDDDKVSESQKKRVENALMSLYKTCYENGIDLEDYI